MKDELDIREVATLSGVQPSTLRFYEKKGLITPIGRHGLRRQYHKNVLEKLELIVLGQAAGFTLDEMAAMVNPAGQTAIDKEQLIRRARDIDRTIRQLKVFSSGLRHIARCTEQDHPQCEEFRSVIARGNRLIR